MPKPVTRLTLKISTTSYFEKYALQWTELEVSVNSVIKKTHIMVFTKKCICVGWASAHCSSIINMDGTTDGRHSNMYLTIWQHTFNSIIIINSIEINHSRFKNQQCLIITGLGTNKRNSKESGSPAHVLQHSQLSVSLIAISDVSRYSYKALTCVLNISTLNSSPSYKFLFKRLKTDFIINVVVKWKQRSFSFQVLILQLNITLVSGIILFFIKYIIT